MYGYLLYLTKNWAVAEDLTGETFEAAFKKWRRFDPAPRHTARMAPRDRPLDRTRLVPRGRAAPEAGGARRAAPSVGTTPTPSARASPPSSPRACTSLSAGEREVVALRIVLDLDGEETARLLGISVTAVSTRLSRALSKLEERMRDHDVVA